MTHRTLGAILDYVMHKITITLRDDVAQWARAWAARHQPSVSRLVGELLEDKMQQEEGYQQAMEQFFSRPGENISEGQPYPSRTELYD